MVRSAFDDAGERRPRSTDVFSSDRVPGYCDGDYPPWLQQEMEYLLPESLLEHFGTRENTSLNGGFWLIPESDLPGICAALEGLGWKPECAQDLDFH